jgi:hypothetical protein
MPTTTGFATDLITFSRGSLATVTDSNGYINWAQHNLLLASEQLDTSSWTKTSATIAANSIAAPDNAITADTIAASGANGTVLQSYTAVAVSYVFGVWLRRKTGTGNIQIAADNGTYTTVTITNDWALYTVTQTPTAGTKSAGIRIVTSGDEVYAWGAHLYRSDLGGMQANASAYPYYNPSTPKNLLGFTEAFDNAAWTKGNSSISANTIAAPNGSLSADTLVSAASTTATFTNQAFTSTAAAYTFSVYVKASGARFVQLLWTGGISTNFANFDLTLATVTSGNYTSASITDAANGWYRLAITSTLSGAAGNTNINLVDSGAATRGSSFTGDGISGVYLWGAQLSSSASLDSYTPNFGAAPSAAAAHGPRLDYDPSTLAAKGLLVEEQRTNLLLNSATLSTQSVTVTATAHTLSFYGTGTITLSGASSAGPLIGTGVYPNRVTLTFTPTAGTLTLTVTGTVSNAQLEAGSFATSYIPTAAASVTRNADVASVGVSQFPYNATEGALIISADYIGQSSGVAYAAALNDGTTSNFMGVRRNPTGETIFVTFATTLQVAIPYTTVTNNVEFKNAFSYKLNDFAGAANGAITGTDNLGNVPSVSRLDIGNITNVLYMNGHIRQITYVPRRLTNAELIARTA